MMEHVSAPYYGVDAEEIWTKSRGVDHVPDAKAPLLILHPDDDGIIKVDQAGMLAEAAKGNDLVRVGLCRPDRTAYSTPQIHAGPTWSTGLLRAMGNLRGAHRGAGGP